jgi:hypothetical protein
MPMFKAKCDICNAESGLHGNMTDAILDVKHKCTSWNPQITKS